MSGQGWDEPGWGPGPQETAETEQSAEQREREARRARQHSVRLAVLAILGAVVLGLMIAIVAPGLGG